MRQKFLRNFKKNLIKENCFWDDDIRDVVHIANISFKQTTKELRDYKKKKNNEKVKYKKIENEC